MKVEQQPAIVAFPDGQMNSDQMKDIFGEMDLSGLIGNVGENLGKMDPSNIGMDSSNIVELLTMKTNEMRDEMNKISTQDDG